MRIYLFGFNTAISYAKMSDKGIRETGYVQKSEYDSICYEYKPNVKGYMHKAWFETNSQGLRDKEYSIEKPDDVFRIAVIGDSFTMGLGINIEDTWHSILEDKGLLMNGKKVEFINFAVEGYNLLPNDIEVLEHKTLKYNPDMIMIGFFAGNDIPTFSEDYIPICDYEAQTLPGPNNFFHSYLLEKTINLFRSIIPDKKLPAYEIIKPGEESEYPNEGALLINLNGLEGEYYSRVFDHSWKNYMVGELTAQFDKLNKLNIPVVLVVYPELNDDPDYKTSELMRVYYTILFHGCNHGFKVIDTLSILESYNLNSLIVSKEDDHFNAYANSLIAEEMFNKFNSEKADLCLEIFKKYEYTQLIPVVKFGVPFEDSYMHFSLD